MVMGEPMSHFLRRNMLKPKISIVWREVQKRNISEAGDASNQSYGLKISNSAELPIVRL
jgi:hypothetical protein